MRIIISLFCLFSISFAGRYYDPAVAIFTSVDPAGQFWNAYSYGPSNPIIGTDPTGCEWDYENMSVDELQAHIDFLSSAEGDALSMYLAIQDSPRLFGNHMVASGALGRNSSAAFDYYNMVFSSNGPRWDILYEPGALNSWRISHEMTHAYDFKVANDPRIFYGGGINVFSEV